MKSSVFTGRNVASQPLTDEVRERYQGQGNAVAAQYNRLLAQYNMLRQGVVSLLSSLCNPACPGHTSAALSPPPPLPPPSPLGVPVVTGGGVGKGEGEGWERDNCACK